MAATAPGWLSRVVTAVPPIAPKPAPAAGLASRPTSAELIVAAALLPSAGVRYPLTRSPIAACTSESAANPVISELTVPPSACAMPGSASTVSHA